MRALFLSAATVLSSFPSLAGAQLSNRSISVESGLSTPLAGGGAAFAALAASAATWLDGFEAGDLEGVLRVALASAADTEGRAAAGGVVATAGLRLSLGGAPLRPQAFAELGWARLRGPASDRIAFGLGAGLEWFPAPDLSLAARAAVRGAGGALAAEAVLAIAAYF